MLPSTKLHIGLPTTGPRDHQKLQNIVQNYRTMILKHLLATMETADSAGDMIKKIDLLDAVYFAKSAWDQVTSATVKNCSRKAFQTASGSSFEEEQNDPEDDIPLSLLAEIYKKEEAFGITNQQEIQDYFNVDEDVQIEEHDTSIEPFLQSEDIVTLEPSDDSDDNVVVIGTDDSIKTYSVAICTVQSLKVFSRTQGDYRAFEVLSNLETHFEEVILKRKTRQTTMDEFLLK